MTSRDDAQTAALPQNAAYTLRTLLKDIPLKEDPDSEEEVYITTVDTWEGNLYIGTSAAEILHFVSISGSGSTEEPAWILASRQQPPYLSEQEGIEKGVRQILILPGAGKACVLCNATLTFYTLPELSPAYDGRIRQGGCTWIGGLDLDQEEPVGDPVICICLRQRLRLIRMGEDARKIRDIELGKVNAIQRRGDLACVADGTTYSLLDVVNQRKNELFPIASSAVSVSVQRNQDLTPSHSRQQSRTVSSISPIRLGRGHTRNTSHNSVSRLQNEDASRVSSPDNSRSISPNPPLPSTTDIKYLPANIISPSNEEFLLTTGTRYDEPGVGLFVNHDGDVVRGTIEFISYPEALVIDNGSSPDLAEDMNSQETFILALVRELGSSQRLIELQRLHEDPAEVNRSKQYIPLPGQHSGDSPLLGTGFCMATTKANLDTIEISNTLRQRRLHIAVTSETDAQEQKRNDEEDKFVSRFTTLSAQILVFTGNEVSWAVRTSIVTRLNQGLEQAIREEHKFSIDADKVQHVLNTVRGQEATTELEFVTLTYIRQKGSLLLFADLVLSTISGEPISTLQTQAVIRTLEEGDIDPRVVLLLVKPLSTEIKDSTGIWLPQGLLDVVTMLQQRVSSQLDTSLKPLMNTTLLQVLKTYLQFWRKKKGFGSIADESAVIQSVDAGILRILLLQDESTPRGPAIAGSVRAELNELVDKGIDCFDRAVELFEEHKRIYMLSRLYQSKKMSAQVLACWRRVLDGEHDAGGELVDGQTDLRRYLTRLRDKELVIEYGSWLASRNPRLGVQVFADESARVTFAPAEAVSILKEKAPNAVKDYLEYMVFGKNLVQYVNDLISFYLSTILAELTDKDSNATATLLSITEAYRALSPPKPTFSDFITDNAIAAEWWSNRLRLLQLIGGSHGAASRYDVHALRTQLAPFSNALVPEMIILNGREGKHQQAIHLLVAGLGDYDTAVRYCLLGGSSIFHPVSSTAAQRPPLPTREEQAVLFQHLLHEFMIIQDAGERLERTSELLERFGGWFDITEVLSLVPAEWAVDAISDFLVSAFRRLIQERNETAIAKALAGAQNLRTSAAVFEKLEGLTPTIIHEQVNSVDV